MLKKCSGTEETIALEDSMASVKRNKKKNKCPVQGSGEYRTKFRKWINVEWKWEVMRDVSEIVQNR